MISNSGCSDLLLPPHGASESSAARTTNDQSKPTTMRSLGWFSKYAGTVGATPYLGVGGLSVPSRGYVPQGEYMSRVYGHVVAGLRIQSRLPDNGSASRREKDPPIEGDASKEGEGPLDETDGHKEK